MLEFHQPRKEKPPLKKIRSTTEEVVHQNTSNSIIMSTLEWLLGAAQAALSSAAAAYVAYTAWDQVRVVPISSNKRVAHWHCCVRRCARTHVALRVLR